MEQSNDEGKGRFPPWSRTVSLPEMTRDAGIDYDQFIESLKNKMSTAEMAAKFKVSEATIMALEEHFWHFGISSVMGGD